MNRPQENEIYADNYKELHDDGIIRSKSVSFDISIMKDDFVEDGNLYYGDDNTNDKQDIDENDALSVVSSIMTADGISDPMSFRINLLVILLGDTGKFD